METGCCIISGYHIERILKNDDGEFDLSLDLGLTRSKVIKSNNAVELPDGQRIGIELLKKINRRRQLSDCFMIKDSSLLFIYLFDGNSSYKLYEPGIDLSPTLWINGSVMHMISHSIPIEESRMKVNLLGKLHGNVLDTCFGLGYSSIELSKKGADTVHSYEISESSLEIAKVNPWSREAFSNPKIKLDNMDVAKGLRSSKDEEYDFIFHDPPNIKMGGDLYSLDFYKDLFRALKPNGILYHFIGSGREEGKHKSDYVRGAMSRLRMAGFKKIKRSYAGVIASK
ncbi:class I SAM-dependent methyltransferase [Candidatus Mancarchaeum acidiphilum]|nr:methyltransferase [Candidatus Mancarchaeum acidiphilum]